MAQAIIWTVFWICAGLGTLGALTAAVAMIRTGGDNYSKKA
jgi:hypothetical protein